MNVPKTSHRRRFLHTVFLLPSLFLAVTANAADDSASEKSTNGNIGQVSQAKRINLLLPENGGHLLVATGDEWLETIDGDESFSNILGKDTEAVYAFKDERHALFDLFTVLVLDTNGNNIKEFELLWGNDSPTGRFVSIGKFQTTNALLFKSPYQEFSFPPVTAKYIKVKLLSSWGESLYPKPREFQLWGQLQ